MHTVIHWFRRDLRISDNTALHEAWNRSQILIPVFIWDDAILRSPDVGPARVAFLLRSLEALARNLETLGHRLIVRHGPPAEQLVRIAQQTKAAAVFTNRDYEPYSVHRDRHAAAELYQAGVYFESFKDSVLWEGKEILTQAGAPYTVFTPYSKAWRARPRPAPVPRIGPAKRQLDPSLSSLPLPQDSSALDHPLSQSLFPAGEHAAQAALKHFVQSAVHQYDEDRNFPAKESGTSRLSPHLRFGTINIRTILHRLTQVAADRPVQRGIQVWESELIWREFYLQILANFPRVATGNFRPEYDQLEWSGTDEQFQAWCAGRTGFPIVDAAMRCLNATGWMHNRLRMIVAMFLTKDLLISWQRGERYFMRQLVDGDLAANNGGWQWSAGTGTDAAPYFRIFNPVTQGEKFDPSGEFIRQWVPELSQLDSKQLHRLADNPLLLSRTGYPPPLIDHARQREKCLAMFKAVKGA
ncbi:MAG: deoxyribodipyrimidine photo-lyase [Verrucomicrobia bacterium]|nr:deoxyribodipyrimidine photo-lyase [Verrucomicrobiota bacterium]